MTDGRSQRRNFKWTSSTCNRFEEQGWNGVPETKGYFRCEIKKKLAFVSPDHAELTFVRSAVKWIRDVYI